MKPDFLRHGRCHKQSHIVAVLVSLLWVLHGIQHNCFEILLSCKLINKDLLLAKPLPGTAGDTRLENVGEIENKGFELSISSVNIEKEDFVWSTSLSLSQNKSELISLGDGQDYITLDDVLNLFKIDRQLV